MGSFLFRWPHAADDVHVTGTFDDWGKTEKLEKVGDVFEKEVNLPSADEKYYYKFVVDDIWTTDHEAPKEDDGHFNVNNILLPEQIRKTTNPMPGDAPGPQTGFASSGLPSKELGTGAYAAIAGGLAAAGGAGAALLSSVTPQSTTANLAGSVPKEGEGAATLSSVTPESTTAELAGSVPKEGQVVQNGSSLGGATVPSAAAAEDEDGDKLGGDDFNGDKRATTVPEEAEDSHSPPGAFPETPANESDDIAVAPIPASAGIGNPVSVPAGEKLPEQSTFNPNTVDSSVTTSKEDYEKDASAAFPAVAATAGLGAVAAAGAGVFAHEKKTETASSLGQSSDTPTGFNEYGKSTRSSGPSAGFNEHSLGNSVGTISDDADSFGVKPISASSGIGNPISVPAGEKLPEQSLFNPNTVDSTVTTSKEDYERDAGATLLGGGAVAGVGGASADIAPDANSTFGVKPIPASSGIGNPISVPAGEKLPEQSSFNPNTVDSTVTTSKEDYERDAGAALLGGGAVAGLGGAALYKGKEDSAAQSAFSVPEKSKNMIPESSLPMGGSVKDTTDTGPFIQSAAPKSSSYYMAATAPMEPKRQAVIVPDDEAPSATLSSPAPSVPEVVKESFSEAHQSPEAAASAEAVQEKSLVENELLSKVKSEDSAGESAPTTTSGVTGIGSATSSSIPEPVKQSILQANASPEAAAIPEAVKEKTAVESELLKQVKSTDTNSESAPTAVSGLTGVGSAADSSVPAPVKESLLKANASPEAAAIPEMVKEKSAVESELLKEVKSTDAAGESAPTATAATSATAPAATSAAFVGTTAATPTRSAGPPALLQSSHSVPFTPATPGVEIMNPYADSPHTRPTTAAQTEPTIAEETTTRKEAPGRDLSPTSKDPNAPATPAKATTTGNTPTKHTVGSTAAGTTNTTSAASSPASTATKDQKKKNRRSFFGKLKDKLKDL